MITATKRSRGLRPSRNLLWPEAATIDSGSCGADCTFEVRPRTPGQDTVAIKMHGQIVGVEDCQSNLSNPQHQELVQQMVEQLD